MISLRAVRKRMPLLVFLLLAVICLILLGIACACATDHPAQNIDRALSAIPAAPPLVEMWSLAFGALILLVLLDVRRRRTDRPSPAALQRFLF